MTEIRKNIDKIPNLRFKDENGKDFPNWTFKKLGEIGEVINGLTYSPNDIDESGILVLRSSNVKNRNLAFDDNVYVKTENYNPVKENDILICVRNGSKNLIGKNALINKESEGLAFGAFMTVYRSSFNQFVFQWFDTKQYKEIIKRNLGATINSINGSDLKKFKIPFPPTEEQQKIFSFLSLLDERISSSMKTIESLETLIKGVSQKLFIQKVRFKEFTDEWRIKTLGEVLIKNSNKNKNQKYSTVQSVSNKYGFINQEEMFEDRRVASNNTSNYYIIEKGYFAYNPSRINVGSLAYKKDEEISVISPLYISFKANNNFLKDEFLWYWFKTIEFIRQMNNSFEGSVRNTLSYESLIKINISIPCKEEQTKIVNFLSKISDKIETEKKILELLEQQKKYFLQNMFI